MKIRLLKDLKLDSTIDLRSNRTGPLVKPPPSYKAGDILDNVTQILPMKKTPDKSIILIGEYDDDNNNCLTNIPNDSFEVL
jgi:hypothetical protein